MEQTMEQEKKIRELMIENENLAAHFRRVSKQGYQLHRMDVDVMLSKTRELYEHLLDLHAQLPEAAYERKQEAPPIKKPNTEPKEEIRTEAEDSAEAQPEPETEVVEEQEEKEPLAIMEQPAETEPEPTQASHGAVKEEIIESSESEEKAEQVEKQPLTNEDEDKIEDEVKGASAEAKSSAQVTNFDLFSQDAPESLGEKLAPNEDHSIAARMQQSPIKDLREAIGINEKFLFINELFKGNLNQYNKSIDELNAFESINGAFTCLIELKVQHQWDEKGIAFKRLKELIERKFK